MFLEYNQPHLNQPVLQFRSLIQVLYYFKQFFREHCIIFNRGLIVNYLPYLGIRACLLVKHYLSGEVLLEIEVLGDHPHVYREFVECLQEEVEAVVVALPQDKVHRQDNHHDHYCQFFFHSEFKDLSRSFHVVSDENERVFQIFNDHLRHLVDGFVPRNF